MIFSRTAVIVLAVLLAACNAVQETTLPNGLKVIVKEDHRAPVVVSQIWYRVGAVDEPDGLTGISHVLEHMMFKGTTKHKAGEFSRIIAENGGRENAFTGSDYTAYFQQLERSRLPISFELEADRMQNLVMQEDEFKKEIKVVMEERRLRTDDQPDALAFEKFMATAFTVHPYKDPIIGWMQDLENLSVDDLREWYRRFYVPNNATLVVVGDVSSREVIALARKHFGPIKARAVEPARITREPPQRETRRSRVRAPAEVPSMLLGFHAPPLSMRKSDWEPYALMVLNGILDGGNSARFARDLVRGRQVAATLDVGYSPTARYPVLFVVAGTPARGHDVGEIEAAVLEQIKRVQEEAVTDEELKRVKAQVVANNVYGRDSVFYQAMQIGMLETCGLDWRLMDEYVDRVRAVTAVQVQEVARKYLVTANLTVTTLDPQPSGMRKKAARAAAGGALVH